MCTQLVWYVITLSSYISLICRNVPLTGIGFTNIPELVSTRSVSKRPQIHFFTREANNGGLNCPYFVGCCPSKAKDRARAICVRFAGCLVIILEFNLLVRFCRLSFVRHLPLLTLTLDLYCVYLLICCLHPDAFNRSPFSSLTPSDGSGLVCISRYVCR